MRALIIPMAALVLTGQFAATVQAQQPSEQERQQQEMERREAERDMRDAEAELEQARERLEQAAREVAELSIQIAPEVEFVGKLLGGQPRAVLGVNIGAGGDSGGDGVYVAGVTPGGPADEAGIKSGDLLVAADEQSFKADSARAANRKLLEFMSKVEPGDDVQLRFLRDGKEMQAKVRTKSAGGFAYSYATGPDSKIVLAPGEIPEIYTEMVEMLGPGLEHRLHGAFFRSWGGMELVTLTQGLGEYFGTSEGLLVVRAPEDEKLDIRDGDVILSIDGRKPRDPGHAMRILRSYQAGEQITMQIVRGKKQQQVQIVLPEREVSQLLPQMRFQWERRAPDAPAAAPGPRPEPPPRAAPAITS